MPTPMIDKLVPFCLAMGLSACAQVGPGQAPIHLGFQAVSEAVSVPTPGFSVQSLGLNYFLSCTATLAPLTPLGYPSVNAQGKLWLPMLATYEGTIKGPQIKGTLRGVDHVTAYITPAGALTSGDFDVKDVVTDSDGETLVAKAHGEGIVLKNGQVPFAQIYTVEADGEGMTTSPRYAALIGSTIYSPGVVNAALTQIKMSWFKAR